MIRATWDRKQRINIKSRVCVCTRPRPRTNSPIQPAPFYPLSIQPHTELIKRVKRESISAPTFRKRGFNSSPFWFSFLPFTSHEEREKKEKESWKESSTEREAVLYVPLLIIIIIIALSLSSPSRLSLYHYPLFTRQVEYH